jgi:hypothetical protein
MRFTTNLPMVIWMFGCFWQWQICKLQAWTHLVSLSSQIVNVLDITDSSLRSGNKDLRHLSVLKVIIIATSIRKGNDILN